MPDRRHAHATEHMVFQTLAERKLGAYAFSGIAMRRPTASGRGRRAWDFRISPKRFATSGGNRAVFFAAMSICSDRFSDVAETQPSVAWKSCWKKCMRFA